MDFVDRPALADVRTATAPLMNLGDCLPALIDIGVEVELGAFGTPANQVTVQLR